MKGGVYIYRTRKPSAFLNWPIVSRHFGYVGETSSFYHRDQQHRYGLSNHGPCQPKPWADLQPTCYRIPLPNWRWLRRVVEVMFILALAPVYNHRHNLWNPRRISLREAAGQRAARDAGYWLPNIQAAHVLAFTGAVLALVWWVS